MSSKHAPRRSGAPSAKMTIGELARRTGMTVRNIRAHQTRGLLPPPEVHGRTGYYGEEHVARIALTREMQADGLNLEAIRRLLEGVDGSGNEILDFTRALRVPFEDEAPEIVEAEELASMWGGAGRADPGLVRRAEKLGILRELPDGRDRGDQPAPAAGRGSAGRAGGQPRRGAPTGEKLRRHAEGAARVFVDLFVEEIWKPFEQAGRPEQDWPKVREALDRVRPLASSALLAIFQITMSEATEKASERTLFQVSQDRTKEGRRRRKKRRHR